MLLVGLVPESAHVFLLVENLQQVVCRDSAVHCECSPSCLSPAQHQVS